MAPSVDWFCACDVRCELRSRPLITGQQLHLAASMHAMAPLCHLTRACCDALQDEAARPFITGQEQLSERQEVGTTASVNSKKVSLHLR